MHNHTAGVVAWMALLIVQPVLIWRRRRTLHRRHGVLAYVVAPFVVGSSVLLMHSRLDPVGAPTFRLDATDSYLAMIAVALFTLCVTLALVFRRNPALHARFMTATLITMVDPISFRMLVFYSGLAIDPTLFVILGYALAELILLGLILADRRRPLRTQGFLMLAPAFVAGHLGYFTLAQSDAWIAFAAAFRGLPLG